MALRHSNQVLPSILATCQLYYLFVSSIQKNNMERYSLFKVLCAASSISTALVAAFSLGLCLEEPWLGDGAAQSLATEAALCIWRAEKVEVLLQRLQRSAKIVESDGIGSSLKKSFAEPFSWFWPGFWGSARRFALIAVSTEPGLVAL